MAAKFKGHAEQLIPKNALREKTKNHTWNLIGSFVVLVYLLAILQIKLQ